MAGRTTATWPMDDWYNKGPRLKISITVPGSHVGIENLEGLVDTGCDASRIEQTLFNRLPRDLVPARTLDFPVAQDDGTTTITRKMPLYVFTVRFLDRDLAPATVEAIPYDLEHLTPGLGFLFGRLFLARYVLTYDGPRSAFTLTTDLP